MHKVLFFYLSLFFISFSWIDSAWFDQHAQMTEKIIEALGPGCHSLSQTGGVLGPLLLSTTSTNPIPSDAIPFPLTLTRTDPDGTSILPSAGMMAVGAAAVGAMAYMANSSENPITPPKILGFALRAYAQDQQRVRIAEQESAGTMGKWMSDKVGSLFTWDNAKKGAQATAAGTVAVGASVVSQYAKNTALKYIDRSINPKEKKSIKHEAPEDNPRPDKMEGVYNTPLGDYTLSELLEISQAEALLGKRGPFSDMLLYVLRNQDSIPIDAKKSVSTN